MERVMKEMSDKVVSSMIHKNHYEFRSIFKFIVAFVGKCQSPSENLSIKKFLGGDTLNSCLIIVGFNIQDEDIIEGYRQICAQTKEGFFLNLNLHEEERLHRNLAPAL